MTEVAIQHDLIFYLNRNTPKVVPRGASPGAVPQGYGPQTKRRPATEDEEKVIARGDWLRVNKGDKRPGEPGYRPGSNIRPHLRDKSETAGADELTVTEAAAVPLVQNSGSIYALVSQSAPEWHKIIKVNPDGSSEVVQDYKLVKQLTDQVNKAMADQADSDDPPEQQQLLMSAWQSLAMYLAACDDEDKQKALVALKVVSALMSDDDSIGPMPDGTFGRTTQVAATVYDCPKCSRDFSTEQGLINHLAAVHAQREKTPYKKNAPNQDDD